MLYKGPPELCSGYSTVLYDIEFGAKLDPFESFIGISSRFFLFTFFFHVCKLIECEYYPSNYTRAHKFNDYIDSSFLPEKQERFEQ